MKIRLVQAATTGEDPGRQILAVLRQHAGQLPLERFCHSGGWPDEATLELELRSIRPAENGYRGSVELRFNERISTGCSSTRNNGNAGGMLSVRLDLLHQELELELPAAPDHAGP